MKTIYKKNLKQDLFGTWVIIGPIRPNSWKQVIEAQSLCHLNQLLFICLLNHGKFGVVRKFGSFFYKVKCLKHKIISQRAKTIWKVVCHVKCTIKENRSKETWNILSNAVGMFKFAIIEILWSCLERVVIEVECFAFLDIYDFAFL